MAFFVILSLGGPGNGQALGPFVDEPSANQAASDLAMAGRACSVVHERTRFAQAISAAITVVDDSPVKELVGPLALPVQA